MLEAYTALGEAENNRVRDGDINREIREGFQKRYHPMQDLKNTMNWAEQRRAVILSRWNGTLEWIYTTNMLTGSMNRHGV